MFHLLAEGPGEPLGSGGRYDSLFERFDLPCPAAGFAFDISNVCWALDASGVEEARVVRVLVCTADADSGRELARALRAQGVACALGPEPIAESLSQPGKTAHAEAYAVRWDYTHVLALSGERAELKRIGAGAAEPVVSKSAAEIPQATIALLRVLEEH
jgi:ATP phosphoribosyltransferase regulatory subunit